ncbi:MAG: endonuclease III [Rickettsiales bacterium]|nr:MAG: endonuclease III [Rickettsiales bacterium]
MIYAIFKKLEQYYNTTSTALTELSYKNTYTLLVATLLSAQATDKGVNKATEPLFKIADTPDKMLKLGEQKLKEYIKTINYYNTKAKHIIELSQVLVEKFDSNVPNNREDLESLSGVGRKTANIVLNIAFKQPNIAVDTHVFRVSNRLGLTKAKNVRESEEQLLKIIPTEYIQNVNFWLVLFGRYICKAQKPDCLNCFLKDHCAHILTNNESNLSDRISNKKKVERKKFDI